MKGSVTINGTRYPVTMADLTPADVLPVFHTDTSILKTDSILLHAAGAEQNSAKKVLLANNIGALYAARDHLENAMILDGDQFITDPAVLTFIGKMKRVLNLFQVQKISLHK